MTFSDLSHSNVTNGWSFMKLILSMYDYSVMIHVKFYDDVIRFREVIALIA